jgi:hypothetical protein
MVYNKLNLINKTMGGCGCKGSKPQQPTTQTTTTNESVTNTVKKTVEKYYQKVKK